MSSDDKQALEQARENLRNANDEVEERHKELLDLYGSVLEKHGHNPKDLVVPDGWDCEESPIGVCAYHFFEDPCHDRCIFCGKPEERK